MEKTTLNWSDVDALSMFSANKVRQRLQQDGNFVQVFRSTLDWGRDRLTTLFQQGERAEGLVRARAHLVDEVLRVAWERLMPAHLGLVAVGGYGRGELLPHSDIDLLLLLPVATLRDDDKRAIEQFFTFLWDIRLEVGSAVRSIEECVKIATDDITVMTNLIESRPLAGDENLFKALQKQISPEHVWPVASFFQAKWEEQQKRHQKYDDTGYKLEPNVKESPGGLRDIHTIVWVAKRHFNCQTLAELRDKGFLTAQEYEDLYGGQDTLWRIRFALHTLTHRHEDRLLFDHQVKVAAMFGYVVEDGQSKNHAIEQFMQLYYRTIKRLSCLNDILLQLFEEAILGRRDSDEVQTLNARFQVRHGYLEVVNDQVFLQNPTALIELFYLLAQHPELDGIRASTLRLLRRDSHLLNDNVRNDVRARTWFIDLFKRGDGLTHTLRKMNRYGILELYLPAFGAVVGHMQYDLFHTLTVDEHSLYVLRNARRLALERFNHELPYFSGIMQQLPRPELLYLATLFHDIAKGRGGDHSELGADDAESFCLAHGLSHPDTALVMWLVKNHLLMSLTAQKKDLTDPQVISDFARKVGNTSRLDYLLLLTVSDIRGTNPALWNSWRESLLKDLYRATRHALARGIDNPISETERVSEQQARALELLAPKGIHSNMAKSVWLRFENDYFLRHTPAELAWHLPALMQTEEHELPLILVDHIPSRGVSVFLYTRDRDHLFGLTTGTLAKMGLNILDARLNTTEDGYTLDTYVVVESDGAPIQNRSRFAEIAAKLRQVVLDTSLSMVDVNIRVSQRLKHFNTPTQVYISQDPLRRRTVLELTAADQPGLLSILGRIFHKRGILLDSAKIATLGERAEDVFTLTDKHHQPITDPAQLDELREVIIRTLDHTDIQISSGLAQRL